MARRVLSAEINHETNTFNRRPTTLESYRVRRLLRGSEIRETMAGTRTEMGAHLDAADRYGWDLVQPISAQATPGGKTTTEAWAEMSGALLSACDEGPVDGVLLALHGAMVTQDQDDAEGDLLAALRERLGPDVPVAITLDLHGNVTSRMAGLANIVIAYRTYPHVDMYDRAMEAAQLLERAMAGGVIPRCVLASGPLIEGCDYGRTNGGPMSRLLQRAAEMKERSPGVLAIALCAGFPWSDVPEVGPTVTVTGEGQGVEYRAIAEALMQEIWDARHEHSVPLYTLAQAMDKAGKIGAESGPGPLVLADFTDNPGSGAYGDGVGLVRAMIEADLPNAAFGTVADPEAARTCIQAGQGARVEVTLGAKVDPKTYGPPLVVTGTVEGLSDGTFVCEGPMNAGLRISMGPTAVLRAGGVRIIIATHNFQVYDRRFFLSQGIDPGRCSIVALKSWHHFRAAFEPIAREVMLVDSGGLASMDLKRFQYTRVRRPVFPLDLE